MKIDKRLVVEILGILSVVASLIFVGMQLMLDRRVAIAGQYQSRAELRLQVLLGQFESSDYLQDRAIRWEANRPSWWNDEIESSFSINATDMNAMVRTTMAWQMFAVNMDNNYFQYQQGLLEAEIWEVYRQQIKSVLTSNPARRSYYAIMTLAVLEELLIELNEEIDSEARIR